MRSKLSTPDKAVIRCLRNAGKKMSVREIRQATGMNETIARATVRGLVRDGYVEKFGGRFRLTDGGRKVKI